MFDLKRRKKLFYPKVNSHDFLFEEKKSYDITTIKSFKGIKYISLRRESR